MLRLVAPKQATDGEAITDNTETPRRFDLWLTDGFNEKASVCC
jgi:hypothetical protein